MKKPADIWIDFTKVSSVLALEHCFTPDGVFTTGVELKQKKSEVFLEREYVPNELAETKQLSDKAAILLISGKKVLSKTISDKQDHDLQQLSEEAFARMDLSNLFFQRVDLDEETIISAIRRDTLEEVLNQYLERGIRIIDVKIGAVALLPMYQVLKLKEQHFGYHTLGEGNHIGLSDSLAEQEITISNEKLKASNLPAYLSGVQYFSGQGDTSHLPTEIAEQAKDEQFKQAYNRLLFSIPIVLLAVLLGSFFAFSHYYAENQQLERHTYEANKSMKMLTSLKETVETKETFLKNNTGAQLNFTEISDRIGASVPKSIALEQLEIYPLKKIHKRTQLLEFEGASLEIKGHSAYYEDYKRWMEDLQAFPFVSRIEILGYGRAETGHGDAFHIKLGLKA